MYHEISTRGGPLSSVDRETSRPYRMGRRAEHIDDTRLRIVEAAVQLHGTVGPAATTIAGIAEQAGVTRATVYRHFPDDASLFHACSAHWLAGQRPPNPGAWAAIADPEERLRAGLADIYRFYRAGEPMLTRIYRDIAAVPEEHQRGLRGRDDVFRDALLDAFPRRARKQQLLRAVIGHAVSFWTWRSLCVKHGLSNEVAVEAMVGLVMHAYDQ
jgi:AcrR family transcriptional regulator